MKYLVLAYYYNLDKEIYDIVPCITTQWKKYNKEDFEIYRIEESGSLTKIKNYWETKINKKAIRKEMRKNDNNNENNGNNTRNSCNRNSNSSFN